MKGIKVEIVRVGDGLTYPRKGNVLRVHYVGYLDDGEKFDSSRDRKEFFEFQLGSGEVINGWEEVVSSMSLGEKVLATIPPEKAYGKEGYAGMIPPNSTLTFEIELLAIR
jgi:FK506-binding protein 1